MRGSIFNGNNLMLCRKEACKLIQESHLAPILLKVPKFHAFMGSVTV